jgi:hypothetical protein
MANPDDPVARNLKNPQHDDVAIGLTAVSLIEAVAAEDWDRLRTLLPPSDDDTFPPTVAAVMKIAAIVINVLDDPERVFASLRELVINQWGNTT